MVEELQRFAHFNRRGLKRKVGGGHSQQVGRHNREVERLTGFVSGVVGDEQRDGEDAFAFPGLLYLGAARPGSIPKVPVP